MHRIFGGRSLRYVDSVFTTPPSYDGVTDKFSQYYGQINPYQKMIYIMCKTLEAFDEDGLITLYGFGYVLTKGTGVFNFKDRLYGASTITTDAPCHCMEEVLNTYTNVIPSVGLSGPTSFAPIINHVMKLLKKSK